jgi:hypothetical protein
MIYYIVPGALLYIAGVVGIALFADMRVNQNSFVSENALLPGYVVTKYQQQSVSQVFIHLLFAHGCYNSRTKIIFSRKNQKYG